MVFLSGKLSVNPSDRTDGHTVFHDDVRPVRMLQAEGFHAGVVAPVEAPVDYGSDTETGSESISDEVVVAFCTACFSKFGVDLRKCSAEGLAISVQVAIVVDEYGYSELLFQEWSERDSVPEGREIREEASDYSVRVVGRSREGEADGHRLLFSEPFDDGSESQDHSLKAQVQVVCIRWKCEGLTVILSAFHCTENQVGAAGIQSQDDSAVVSDIRHIPNKLLSSGSYAKIVGI